MKKRQKTKPTKQKKKKNVKTQRNQQTNKNKQNRTYQIYSDQGLITITITNRTLSEIEPFKNSMKMFCFRSAHLDDNVEDIYHSGTFIDV